MAGIPVAIGAALIGATASVATAVITKPKKPKAAAAAPQRGRLEDRSSSVVRDALLARAGTRDNQRTGLGGAEAPVGIKSKLGQ